jgi:hypothetical protein
LHQPECKIMGFCATVAAWIYLEVWPVELIFDDGETKPK